MKIAISYFYQIRFFKPWMIPVSTACFDPKWFHQWSGPNFTFLDKRNVVNGLRCEELHPGPLCEGLCRGRDSCDDGNPNKCAFLQQYMRQLENMDLDQFLQRAAASLSRLKQQLNLDREPLLVLIVYEIPNNPCSERQALLKYFNSHGIECEELKYPIGENYE